MTGTSRSEGDTLMNPELRKLLMTMRQALIIALGALEDYLNLERSIIPRRKRNSNDG